jgi:hypothetical protein
MTDSISQQNLKNPEQVDWDSLGKTSKYQAPPPALGPDGKPITYHGKLTEIKLADPDQGFLQYMLTFKLLRSGPYDGLVLRTWVSTRPFMRKNKDTGELEPIKGNPNSFAKMLKAAGLQAKPQTNDQYEASIKQVLNKDLSFTTDWTAKNKDNGEVVQGYKSFPEDPLNPGSRKSILRAGDTYSVYDREGNLIETKTVTSEILFANSRIQYFQDSTPKRAV